MKIVQYYDSEFEAEVVKGRLESEGIRAFVQNSLTTSVLPYLHNSSSRPYVEVTDEDFDRATAILRESVKVNKTGECPECGSKEFKFVFHRKDKEISRFSVFAVLSILLLTFTTPGKIRRDYHCSHCGTWF